MFRRAAALATRLRPHLPAQGTLLDVGSGTGHNARVLRERTPLRITELDVTDLNCVGGRPVLFAGEKLPFPDESFTCVTMLYALQYVPDPLAMLREFRRVATGSALLLQSTCATPRARRLLAMREFTLGRGACRLAECAGLVPASAHALRPLRYFQRGELLALCLEAGWARATVPDTLDTILGVSRDLFLLEK